MYVMVSGFQGGFSEQSFVACVENLTNILETVKSGQ